MFGRKNKDKGAVGTSCPYCEYNNPLGSETCEQCYYELNKSARDQPMATPTTSNDDIMSLLLGDNEFEEEAHEVVEAVLTMDDVTVDVGQYDLPVPAEDEEGEPVPESFEFIGSHGPTLSQTVVATEEEEEVELTAAEFAVLELLVESPSRAFTRAQIAARALPDGGERVERTVDTYVYRLRRKLGPAFAKQLRTIVGVGYRLDPG